jgi:hypothetical protein
MADRTLLAALLAETYDPAMQIAPSQIEAIAGAVMTRGPACSLLVFGAGHDTPLWHHLNRAGTTLFVENVPAFIADAARRVPEARVLQVEFEAHTTVFGAMALSLAQIDAVPLPDAIGEREWDVILIDGPAGHHMTDPGRALPIRWASRLMTRRTHVFVDDYNRPVERHFADLLIRSDNPPCAVLVHEREAGKTMLWRIGRSMAGPAGADSVSS